MLDFVDEVASTQHLNVHQKSKLRVGESESYLLCSPPSVTFKMKMIIVWYTLTVLDWVCKAAVTSFCKGQINIEIPETSDESKDAEGSKFPRFVSQSQKTVHYRPSRNEHLSGRNPCSCPQLRPVMICRGRKCADNCCVLQIYCNKALWSLWLLWVTLLRCTSSNNVSFDSSEHNRCFQKKIEDKHTVISTENWTWYLCHSGLMLFSLS